MSIFETHPHIKSLNHICSERPDEDLTPLKVFLKGGAWIIGHPYKMWLDYNLLVLSDRSGNICAEVALTEIAAWVWMEDGDLP